MLNATQPIKDLPRKCKDCGTPIAKGKQLCEACRSARRKEQWRQRDKRKNRSQNFWAPRDGFKRDERGNVIQKKCSQCGEWKAADYFGKRSDTASGLVAACKTCYKVQSKSYRKPSVKKLPVFWRKQCNACGETFVARTSQASYCSESCRSKVGWVNQRLRQLSRIHGTSIESWIIGRECKHCGEFKGWSEFGVGNIMTEMSRRVCLVCAESQRKEQRRKRRKNPKNKIQKNLRRRFKELMDSARCGGSLRFSKVVGCTTKHLREHIEAQFKRPMKWENYGYVWHIDHIEPVSRFDHRKQTQVKACWHYSNLRPLLAEENLEKSDKRITHQPELLIELG